MDERRMKGLMGLCVRAGQAVFGADGCQKAIREGKAALLLLDGDIAENAREKYTALCAGACVPLRLLPAGLMEASTGRTGMTMAVRPGGFAEQMTRCLEASGDEEE